MAAVITAIWFGGCGEHTYSRFYVTEREPLHCLAPGDAMVRFSTEAYFAGVFQAGCPFVLDMQQVRANACSDPKSRALGSDSDGYVRLEVRKGGRRYYRVQSDYRGDASGEALKRACSRLKKELDL